MLKNYIKIAWRNLRRQKSYSAINIGGLTVALTVFLIIVLYIRHETNYDTFIADSDRLYRVMMSSSGSNFNPNLPEPVGSELLELYPEVEDMVKLSGPFPPSLLSLASGDFRATSISAGSGFFRLFNYQFLAGNPEEALLQPESIVLTESLARRLFGRLDVIGESIRRSNTTDLTVTGVIADPPTNTHLPFEFIQHRTGSNSTNWNLRSAHTYLKLSSPADSDNLEEKLPDYVDAHKTSPNTTPILQLQPVTSIHLYPDGPGTESSRLFYVRVLMVVGLLILLVGCINYINLAISRITGRSTEVGVRKVIGASRYQVISQMVMESLVITLIAFLFSLLLVELLSPFIQQYFDVRLVSVFDLPANWIFLLMSTVFLIGLSGGILSSLYFSSLKIVQVLKGEDIFRSGYTGGFRKGLVVLQFAISISIILSTVIIIQQVEFIRDERLNGLDDQIITILNVNSREEGHSDLMKQELLRHPDILYVSGANRLPTQIGSTFRHFGDTDTTVVYSIFADSDYLETLGLKIISGRNFEPGLTYPSEGPVMLNATAAQLLGFDEVSGQLIESQVIGVYNNSLVAIVEDFHPSTLFEPVLPVVIRPLFSGRISHFLIRFREGSTQSALVHLREVWSELNPEWPFEYQFLDEVLDEDYKAELQMAKIFRTFSGFSIFIACLGLFGLAAVTAQRRTKEIGIRKVLGATVSSIVALLNRDYLVLVLGGFLMAIPIAWYAMNRWLEDFAFRIEIGPGVFLLAGLAAILIALATVSWQSVRAALANPVDSLRSE